MGTRTFRYSLLYSTLNTNMTLVAQAQALNMAERLA